MGRLSGSIPHGTEIAGGPRPPALTHHGARARERVDRGAYGGGDRLIALLPDMIGRHADAKLRRAVLDAPEEVRDRPVDRDGIARVVSRDRRHRESDVA